MRVINIPDCTACPHLCHRGGFWPVAYIPVCGKTDKNLGYKPMAGTRLVKYDCIIPDWCPLEKATLGSRMEPSSGFDYKADQEKWKDAGFDAYNSDYVDEFPTW